MIDEEYHRGWVSYRDVLRLLLWRGRPLVYETLILIDEFI